MAVITEIIHIRSKGENDMIDITASVSKAIEGSKFKQGIVTIFIAGSTAAVTTIEYEPGLKTDFPKMLSRIAPNNIEYEHDGTWHDGNGHSHVRASLVGPSLTIPIKDSRLLLGMAANSRGGNGYQTKRTKGHTANNGRVNISTV